MEKDWEKGDDPDVLKPEDQIEMERLEAKNRNAFSFDNFDPDDPDSMMMLGDNAGKPGKPLMFFAHVNLKKIPKGMSKTDRGSQIREMLLTGGVKVEVYDIDEKSYLLTSKDGSQLKSIKDYLFSLPEVTKITIDQKDFFPPNKKRFYDDEDEAGSTKGEAKGKRGKKKSKKGKKEL